MANYVEVITTDFRLVKYSPTIFFHYHFTLREGFKKKKNYKLGLLAEVRGGRGQGVA